MWYISFEDHFKLNRRIKNVFFRFQSYLFRTCVQCDMMTSSVGQTSNQSVASSIRTTSTRWRRSCCPCSPSCARSPRGRRATVGPPSGGRGEQKFSAFSVTFLSQTFCHKLSLLFFVSIQITSVKVSFSSCKILQQELGVFVSKDGKILCRILSCKSTMRGGKKRLFSPTPVSPAVRLLPDLLPYVRTAGWSILFSRRFVTEHFFSRHAQRNEWFLRRHHDTHHRWCV